MMTEENDETQKASQAENQEVLKESVALEPKNDTSTTEIEIAAATMETESDIVVESAIEQDDVSQDASEQAMIDTIMESEDMANEASEPAIIDPIMESEDMANEASEPAMIDTIIESTPFLDETDEQIDSLVKEIIVDADIIENEKITEPEVNSTSEMLDIKVPTQEHANDDKTIAYPVLDYNNLSKESLLPFFEAAKSIIQAQAASGTFKRIDEITKEAKIAFEKIKFAEKNEALAKFKESNEQSEEGFSFKGDEINQKIDSSHKNKYFCC